MASKNSYKHMKHTLIFKEALEKNKENEYSIGVMNKAMQEAHHDGCAHHAVDDATTIKFEDMERYTQTLEDIIPHAEPVDDSTRLLPRSPGFRWPSVPGWPCPQAEPGRMCFVFWSRSA